MSTQLHLCDPGDLDRLAPLAAALHGIDDEAARLALAPLLGGAPQGAVYLLGPRRAPVGYLLLSFGWSVPLGGLTGTLTDLFIRPAVRGRGIATEAVTALIQTMKGAGLAALHIELPKTNGAAHDHYKRLGFSDRAAGSHLTLAF